MRATAKRNYEKEFKLGAISESRKLHPTTCTFLKWAALVAFNDAQQVCDHNYAFILHNAKVDYLNLVKH